MTRGPKKHMKRLNAPSHWMLDKLGGIFVSIYLSKLVLSIQVHLKHVDQALYEI